MKHFVEYFKTVEKNSKPIPEIGMNSILPLDNRLSLNNMINKAISHGKQLQNISSITHFRIMIGNSILELKPITNLKEI